MMGQVGGHMTITYLLNVLLLLALALLVVWKHRANIDRLSNGTEPRIGRTGG